jgi:2-polyprenyl-3-methyl-5-hydroxy-6-metoxy-1,4-benzoquinol methylase
MLTTEPNAPPELIQAMQPVAIGAATHRFVVLVDGTQCDLLGLSTSELIQLQAEQEPAFASRIVASPKGSLERSAAVRQAYETVCEVLDEVSNRQAQGQSLSMGMDPRYIRLVLELLGKQKAKGVEGGFFELGFGSGIMLEAAARAGYRVGGLEVAGQLFDEAKNKLPVEHHGNLWLGDFCATDFGNQNNSYGVVYWNDVFEHIPADEISDYLLKLNGLLKPGGKLVTITPNWHMRPSDVTVQFNPPRTTASGFHLKEYTLAEVRKLLLSSGFARVQTPTYISRSAIYLSDMLDITSVKASMEPLLEMLPFKAAVQACRRFGLNCTIATKGS